MVAQYHQVQIFSRLRYMQGTVMCSLCRWRLVLRLCLEEDEGAATCAGLI